ncbi:MAG: T9SS type A sorting domain-containing protein, partial [Muribaculaceae bacterium]|nr:T9SS type A sorting domain-containing protein [Muribaculaceae bacterium]
FTINGGTSGANHVGLIGGGSATFENVAIVGDVIGNDHVGLVAGDADGIEMTNCYAVGTVLAGSQVGGYFGCTLEGGCSLENCLSNVSVTANYRGWAGGFIGLIDKANSAVTIKNCVSIGDCSSTGDGSPHVTAPFIAGNGAGDTPNAVITFSGNIYSSAAVMGADTQWPSKNETAEGGLIEAATAQNPATLQTQAPYTAIGWDFDGVWKMGEGEYKYPVLCTVTVTDFSGIDEVVADVESNVSVVAANGEIIVSGLGETSVIAVYNAAGVQVATASVTSSDAVVAVPANGFYIVAVTTDGSSVTSKVVVK